MCTSFGLVPLNKCPGVRPIGVGEVLRRIIGKAVMRIVQTDVATAASPLQVCAGLKGGYEAAVHAMREVSSCDDTEAILFVDAANAFNNLNRKAAPAQSTVHLSCLGNHLNQCVSITNKQCL